MKHVPHSVTAIAVSVLLPLIVFFFTRSWWWFLTTGLLILGTLGYFEAICGLKWSRRTGIAVLIMFLTFSIAQILLSRYSEKELESDLVAVRDYSDMAELDLNGLSLTTSPPITYSSKLSRMLEGSYKVEGQRLQFKTGSEVEQKLRAVIQAYPRFPFGHYALAYCLSQRESSEWREHAQEAIKILEYTTRIKGHKPIHDEILAELKKALEEKQAQPGAASDGHPR